MDIILLCALVILIYVAFVLGFLWFIWRCEKAINEYYNQPNPWGTVGL